MNPIDWYNTSFETPRPVQEVRSVEQGQLVGGQLDAYLAEIRGIFGESGKINSGRDAMKIVSVSSAVNFIADQAAALPVHIFENTADGPKAVESDLSMMLKGAINDEFMSFQQLRKIMFASYLLNGRAYAHIERDGLGRVKNIRPMQYDTVTPQRVDGKKVYTEKLRGKAKINHSPADIIDFVQLLNDDGITHYNPVDTHKVTLNSILAAENFSQMMFGKNGIPPLQLLNKKPFNTPATQRRAVEQVEEEVVESRSKMFVALPSESELKSIGLTPADLELIQSKKWNLQEVARIFNLPPQFLQDLSHSTYSNSEQQSQVLVKFNLQPNVNNFEREFNLKVFGNKSSQYIKFNFHSLMRGDFLSQINGLAKAVLSGIMTPNEARDLLELQNKEGGDELFMQGAQQTLENLINIGKLSNAITEQHA